jgi:hypothetical protein
MSLMAVFQVHRIRDHAFQQFRWAPHTAGASQVRPRDYENAEPIEAPSPYAAWMLLRDSGRLLRVGDLLEDESGALRIFKYVGFEEAHWLLPEPQPTAEPTTGDAIPLG